MRYAVVLLLGACLVPHGVAGAQNPDLPYADRIDQWILDLKSDDLLDRWYAAYALGQAGPAAAAAVDPLMSILGNLGGHEYVRGTAAWALGRIGTQAEQAVPLLIETLDSAHISVRRNSPRALGAIGAPAAAPAVPRLLGLLSDRDPEVRANAAMALWQIERHERAIPALTAMLAGPRAGVYEAAVAFGQLEAVPEQAVLEALVGTFTHRDPAVRQAAARSAGAFGEAALPAMQQALGSEHTEARQAALEALGWVGRSAVGVVMTALKDPSPAVRRTAAQTLGRLGADALEAEQALVAALDDPNAEVRKAVAWAIRRVRG